MEGAINIQQQINSLIRFADDIVLLRPREREREQQIQINQTEEERSKVK